MTKQDGPGWASERSAVLGWSRTKVRIRSGPVLDLGSGAFPNAAADLLCDSLPDDSVHRHGLGLVADRPLVVGDGSALPFADHAIGYLIASHIAEHVADPETFCSELARVARAGYVETPSPLADWLLHEEYHLWRVSSDDGVLRFRAKGPRGPIERRVSGAFYWIFYAGQTACSGRTLPLPDNRAGRVLREFRRLVAGALNRSGIMHTRHHFGEGMPLEFQIESR